MAQSGQQIDELFISLGLDIAQLQLDFDTAGQTVSSAIAQLNRESNNIKIQMEMDLSKLDGVGSELDKIKVKQEAINHQLDLQRQKESILAAVLKDAQKNTGVDSGASKKAETDLLRQQKLIAETEAAWRKLEQAKNAAQDSKTTNADTKISQLTLGGLISKFHELKDAASSSDGALTKILGIIENIPHPAGKAVAALVAIPLVLKQVEDSLLDFAKPAITAGDAFYVMSRGMQMSIADAAKLSTICKVTGIDINEVNSALRRFSTQVNKAGSDSAMIKMLERYGAQLRDTNGRVKNEIELAEELSAALKKAQAEGNGAAFRDIVGGKFWSGDVITFLEDFQDNVEQAKKVVKNGLADPVRAHAIQGELNTLEAQAGQLNSAFSSAFLPIAEKIVPHATQRLGELTEVIAENADAIKTVGSAVADVVNTIEDVATAGATAILKTAGGLNDFLSKPKKDLIQRYVNDDDVKSAEDLMNKELQRRPPTERFSVENNPALYQQTLNYYESYYQDLQKARKKIEEESEKINEAIQKPLTGASMYRLNSPEISEADLESLRKAREETQKLSDELFKLTHSDYENKKLDVFNWRSKLLNDESTTAEQREIIEKITAEKISQIEQEKEEKISQIRQSANAQFQNNIQNKIAAIEQEKDAWIKAGMEESEATTLAEQKKAETIKNFENEVAAEIRSIWGTEFENRLAQIDAEKQAWIQKGLDEAYATQLTEAKKAKAIQDFNNQAMANLYSSWQNELEKRMSQIDREAQVWKQKGVSEAAATAWAENEKAKTMKNFENEVVSQIDSIWQTELENRLKQIDKEKQAWIQKGADEVKATKAAEEAKMNAKRDAAKSVLKQQSEEYSAYKNGGYGGLLAYKKMNLIESGIDPDDLYMTPQQLEDFQKANQIAEKSLMPNLMTDRDRAESRQMLENWWSKEKDRANTQNYIEIDGQRYADMDRDQIIFQKETPQGTETWSYNPDKFYQRQLADLGPQQNYQDMMYNPTNNFDNQMPSTEITDLSQALAGLGELSPAIADASTNIATLNESFTNLPELSSAITDASSNVSTLIDSFSDLNELAQTLSDVSAQLSDLNVAITDFSNKLPETYATDGDSRNNSQSQPIEVTNNIEIGEAHAWDYDHIQELAEKVADIIKPEIERALNSSNSY